MVSPGNGHKNGRGVVRIWSEMARMVKKGWKKVVIGRQNSREMVKEWPEMVEKKVSDGRETVGKWSPTGRRNVRELAIK